MMKLACWPENLPAATKQKIHAIIDAKPSKTPTETDRRKGAVSWYDFVQIIDNHPDLLAKLPKKKQLEQNRTWFVGKIQSNMFVRADYKDRHQPVAAGKQSTVRTVLVGWRRKTPADMNDDE